jgi:hypothetical protein
VGILQCRAAGGSGCLMTVTVRVVPVGAPA